MRTMQKGQQAIDLLIYTSLTVCTESNCNFVRTIPKKQAIELVNYTSLTACTKCMCNFVRTMKKVKPLFY